MPVSKNTFGKLVSVHGISPAHLQRAAIVAVLSFVFFLAMLVGFYIRQHIGYFVISTAFLIVYLFTLISWVMQRRNVVSIFENGITYKKFSGRWDEIESATLGSDGANRKYIEITKQKREKVTIPSSIQGFDRIVQVIESNVAANS